jgi:transposase
MTILWEEYREANPDGYGYSRFCDLLRGFERRLTPVMRQHHVAGQKAFVDYSGKRIGIVDPTTGEIREAEIFVAVLGASNLTYAEATWTQQLPDWTGAHLRMFRFGSRQSEEWGQQGLLLRPRDQPNLRRHGGALLGQHPPGATGKAYGSVKSILDNKLDRRPAPRRPADTAPIHHPNIRGPRYYH